MGPPVWEPLGGAREAWPRQGSPAPAPSSDFSLCRQPQWTARALAPCGCWGARILWDGITVARACFGGELWLPPFLPACPPGRMSQEGQTPLRLVGQVLWETTLICVDLGTKSGKKRFSKGPSLGGGSPWPSLTWRDSCVWGDASGCEHLVLGRVVSGSSLTVPRNSSTSFRLPPTHTLLGRAVTAG